MNVTHEQVVQLFEMCEAQLLLLQRLAAAPVGVSTTNVSQLRGRDGTLVDASKAVAAAEECLALLTSLLDRDYLRSARVTSADSGASPSNVIYLQNGGPRDPRDGPPDG